MSDLISIIVPVFNVEAYLQRCVNSLQLSTYPNIEIILVDDGSTDQSGKICDVLSLTDNRIKVVHKKNGGLSDARNTGLKIAKGEFIGFVDSDDWVEPSMYEILHQLIVEYNTLISCCNKNRVIGEQKPNTLNITPTVTFFDKKEAIRSILYPKEISNSVCDKLFHRSVFESIQFPIGTFREDVQVMYRIIHQYGDVIYTNQSLYNYFERENSLTTSNFNPAKISGLIVYRERVNFIKTYYPELIDAAYLSLIKAQVQLFLLASKNLNQANVRNAYQVIVHDIRCTHFKFVFLNKSINNNIKIKYLAIILSPKLASLFYRFSK